jgi:tetratricopeptide (TPR) repeat protein
VAARRGRYVESEETFRAAGAQSVYLRQTGLVAGRAVGTLWSTGLLQKALQDYNETIRLAPASAGVLLSAARAYAAAGNFEETRRLSNKAIEAGVDTKGRQALQLLAQLAESEDRHEDAAGYMIAALSAGARGAGGEDTVRKVYAALVDQAKAPEAIRALNSLTSKLTRQDWVVKVWAMNWHTQLGAVDEAYALAGQLHEDFGDERPTNAWSWLWSVEMRPFRRDARFSDFTARLGMHEYWKKYGPPDECSFAKERLTCT